MSAFGNSPDHTQDYVAAVSQGMVLGNQSFVPMWFVGMRRGDVRTTSGKLVNVPLFQLSFGTNWSRYRFEKNRSGTWTPYCLSTWKPPQESEQNPCCLVNGAPFRCHEYSPHRHHNSHPSRRGWFS